MLGGAQVSERLLSSRVQIFDKRAFRVKLDVEIYAFVWAGAVLCLSNNWLENVGAPVVLKVWRDTITRHEVRIRAFRICAKFSLVVKVEWNTVLRSRHSDDVQFQVRPGLESRRGCQPGQIVGHVC